MTGKEHGGSRKRKGAGGLTIALVVILVLTGLEVGRRMLFQDPGSTLDAQWIWAPDADNRRQPRAFFLARDFTLDEIPEQASLLVLADQEYVLFLNGQRVGSNRYHPGALPDRYEVRSVLRNGPNRILVEVRSDRGMGGLLACLDSGGGSCVVATDGSWQAAPDYRESLIKGWNPLGDRPFVRVWGKPPLGAWGVLEDSVARPRFQELLGPLGQREEPAAASGRRTFLSDDRIQSVFDFGRPVTGFLEVEFLQDSPGQAVAFWDTRAIRPGRRPPDARIMGVRGQRVWRWVRPVTLRYLTVFGPNSARKAWMDPIQLEVAEERAGDLLRPLPEPETLLGVEPWWVANGGNGASHESTQ